jgi:hypothetical protein
VIGEPKEGIKELKKKASRKDSQMKSVKREPIKTKKIK